MNREEWDALVSECVDFAEGRARMPQASIKPLVRPDRWFGVRRAYDGSPDWKHVTPSDRIHCWFGIGRYGVGFWFNSGGGEIGLVWWILGVRWMR